MVDTMLRNSKQLYDTYRNVSNSKYIPTIYDVCMILYDTYVSQDINCDTTKCKLIGTISMVDTVLRKLGIATSYPILNIFQRCHFYEMYDIYESYDRYCDIAKCKRIGTICMVDTIVGNSKQVYDTYRNLSSSKHVPMIYAVCMILYDIQISNTKYQHVMQYDAYLNDRNEETIITINLCDMNV